MRDRERDGVRASTRCRWLGREKPLTRAIGTAATTTRDADVAAESRRLLVLCVTALGVVYGDIGTSPIYALRESLHIGHGVAATADSVLGVLSLIFWSLVLVISLKYLFLVMRADNGGEGGIMALTALVTPPSQVVSGRRRVLVLIGLFGAALLYGDSMITPAISVLSAVEGLEVATPFFQPYVIPITVVILVALFSGQSRGTARVGAVFGPVMLVWFAVLAGLGLYHVASHPDVLTALSPHHAVRFFATNRLNGLLALGSVFLVVTGGEALYADMGHFGRRPIRLSWFSMVLPALLLNYLGQGALIIHSPAAVEQPFFLMAPRWALYPLVGLTTLATVIASQAVISGAFSLTRQATLLGYLPRARVDHTSAEQRGQIYLPAVNWALMLACIGLVLGFRTSGRLAAAYGVAVTTDMVFTTALFAVVALRRWRWHPLLVGVLAVTLLTIDLAFWGANLPKVPHGGWFPLIVAGAVFALMTTWKRGRQILWDRLQAGALPLRKFLADLAINPPTRVPGLAIFLTGQSNGVPTALLHNLKHNRVLHERVVFLTVVIEDVPVVPRAKRADLKEVGEGFYRMTLRYGFMQDPNVPHDLKVATPDHFKFRLMETTFFLGRETLIPSKRPGMALWRETLFAFMSRNSQDATAFFRIPPNRVVELGVQVEL
jgi:KUP system potassium uptake protein